MNFNVMATLDISYSITLLNHNGAKKIIIWIHMCILGDFIDVFQLPMHSIQGWMSKKYFVKYLIQITNSRRLKAQDV